MHRVSSGHALLHKFAFLMRKSVSFNCVTFRSIEDLHHLLRECAWNNAQRRTITDQLKLNIIDKGKFHKLLTVPASQDVIEFSQIIIFFVNMVRSGCEGTGCGIREPPSGAPPGNIGHAGRRLIP